MSLCKTPNQHAQKPALTIVGDEIFVKGYSSYRIKDKTLFYSSHKFDSIKPYLMTLNKKVVDLGCANGLFSIFTALYDKSNQVYAVDIDPTHLDMVGTISEKLDLNIETRLENVEAFNTEVDITIALALIHWIYSCTSDQFGSLEKIIEWMSSITKECLIIEWVDAPNDTNVNFFKHIEYNPEIVTQEYTKENFDNALNKYFKRVELICNVNNFRQVYAAYK